jgi:hypothetical protein
MVMVKATRRAVLALGIVVLAAWPGVGHADAALDWFTTVDEATNKVTGARGDRARAIAWLAAFNALDAIEPRFRPYAPAPATVTPGGAAPAVDAALATALYTALVVEPDADHALLVRRLRETLATVKNEAEREAGAGLGRQAATLLLLARAGDKLGRIEPEPREPKAGEFVAPAWVKMPRSITQSQLAPFGVRSVTAFDPGPPPAVGSALALRDIAEVRDLGAVASKGRSADQTAAALFWNSSEPSDFTAFIKARLEARKLDPLAMARIMALDAMISFDAGIVNSAQKERYVYWRPEGAITGPLAGPDRDPAWQTLVRTPPNPDYPSGGATFAGVTEVEMARLFEVEGAIEIRNGHTGQLRRWPSAQALADELASARVWAGAHFRNSVETARRVGRAVTNEILDRQLLPR